MKPTIALLLSSLLLGALLPTLAAQPADLALSGELKQWHKVTLTLAGPSAREQDTDPNPFTDYRLTVTFTHESGTPSYRVPGYFAADGNAAHSSAETGNLWRAHLAPDKPGRWTYTVSFVRAKHAALDPAIRGDPVAPCDGRSGQFTIAPTDKSGRDFRAHGRLQYVGQHHLQFAGSRQYFLKAGADSPENLLAYADFDGTWSRKRAGSARPGEAAPAGLKTWQPHLQDWQPGNPTWKDGKGKGLIGALNYLAGTGCNAFSFLPYNAGGDGDDVWPFIAPEAKLHYDCSKLDQWQIVFDHATALGLYAHFKLQETEIDDLRRGHTDETKGTVPEALDGGDLGPERKLYCRELIARFGHLLALNWNLGEENTQTPEQQRAMAQYLHDTDPYRHLIVVHTFPDWQDRVYPPLLGDRSVLTGASLQNSWSAAHQRTLKWIEASAQAGKPWVVANDEQNPADQGVPADPGYQGHDGKAMQGGKPYDLHDIRKLCLWGTLSAGGAGVEYYFGYKLPQNDLVCQDWRSRARSWEYCRIALGFFRDHALPFWDMRNADALVGNPKHDNSRYCLAKAGELYVVYLPNGGSTGLDLSAARGTFTVRWFNPRAGGALQTGPVREVQATSQADLGRPPTEPDLDWVILIRRSEGG
ncbi:MAG: DUF5060 domain-containing protein [Verrucomicrobia bacterium]|nr:DUF5060 domain-containing protein [Verrucomicrobiota bacterium]